MAVDRQAERLGETLGFGYVATGAVRTLAKCSAARPLDAEDRAAMNAAATFLEAASNGPDAMDSFSFDSRSLRSVIAFDTAAEATSRAVSVGNHSDSMKAALRRFAENCRLIANGSNAHPDEVNELRRFFSSMARVSLHRAGTYSNCTRDAGTLAVCEWSI